MQHSVNRICNLHLSSFLQRMIPASRSHHSDFNRKIAPSELFPKSSAKPVARLEPKCQKLCAFYLENVNNKCVIKKCAHTEIHLDVSYTLYFIQVFFTTENISTKIHTKHYINRISVYNTHLCPAPARKQSFLIFFYIFNTF